MKKCSASGAEKSLMDWSRDTRCQVCYATLRIRTNKGIPMELALQGDLKTESRARLFEAFGERKSLAQWAADERCHYTVPGIIARLRAGLSPQEAIGGGRRNGPRPRRAAYWQVVYRAYGEENPLQDWVTDPRFGVVTVTFLRRVSAGISPEVAMRKSQPCYQRVHRVRQTSGTGTETTSRTDEDALPLIGFEYRSHLHRY